MVRSISAATVNAFVRSIVSTRKRFCQRMSAWIARRICGLSSLFQLSLSGGALISRISEGSPAEKAGLKIGDVIISFAGNKVRNSAQLRELVARAESGTYVRIDVMRNGRKRTFTVRIA
jgi:S1-C subfamily serine protease